MVLNCVYISLKYSFFNLGWQRLCKLDIPKNIFDINILIWMLCFQRFVGFDGSKSPLVQINAQSRLIAWWVSYFPQHVKGVEVKYWHENLIPVFNHRIHLGWHANSCKVRSRYLAVTFLKMTHERHPYIALMGELCVSLVSSKCDRCFTFEVVVLCAITCYIVSR